MKIALSARIVSAINKYGKCSTSRVVDLVGRFVCASQACRAWERERRGYFRSKKMKGNPHDLKRPADKIRTGTRRVIGELLKRLAEAGRIVRVRRGVYGPASLGKEVA